MNKRKCKIYFIAFFIIASAFSMTAAAQEFRGFYGNSREIKNAHLSRDFKSTRFRNGYSGYRNSNRESFNYKNGPRYLDCSFYQPREGNHYAYPATNLTINIFTPNYPHPGNDQRSPGTLRYYNKGSSYYNQITDGAQNIKINGQTFYRMNGNYYPADRFENLTDVNNQYTQFRDDFYKVKRGNIEPGFSNLIDDGYSNKYFVNGYNNREMSYLKRRGDDNTLLKLQKEKKRLQQQNGELQQRLYEQRARAFEEERISEQLKEANAAEIEIQEKMQKDGIRWKEAIANNESEENTLYNNLKIGDTVKQVPKHSKVIIINGEKTFISPGHIYFQTQPDGRFVIVGMEAK